MTTVPTLNVITPVRFEFPVFFVADIVKVFLVPDVPEVGVTANQLESEDTFQELDAFNVASAENVLEGISIVWIDSDVDA